MIAFNITIHYYNMIFMNPFPISIKGLYFFGIYDKLFAKKFFHFSKTFKIVIYRKIYWFCD